ncbi:hypothetical protein Leryth_027365 [Lithospermum erythrorhizon]|nr:hypothetical protein Leryth_027365 [Lithospermum erythrorhizon]
MADGEVAKPPEDVTKPPPSWEGVNRPIHSQLKSYPYVVQGQIESEFQPLNPNSYNLKSTSQYQNKPSVVFTSADKKVILVTMKHVLVGKFTHGRPSIAIIREFFVSLKLRGYEMRVFKWSPISPPSKNPQLHLFGFELKPLRVDLRNINRVNLSSARICVELDVSQPLVDSIYVCFEDEVSHEVLEGFCWGDCKRRTGKDMDANKVFDILPQPGNSAVGKVFDELPQSGNTGKSFMGLASASLNQQVDLSIEAKTSGVAIVPHDKMVDQVTPDSEANQGVLKIDLEGLQGHIVEHCGEVQDFSFAVMQQPDQVVNGGGSTTVTCINIPELHMPTKLVAIKN